jgi:hypothetical protein
MTGMREQLAGRRGLHHLTGVHDDDPVADLGDHSQVVGDEEDSHPDLVAHLGEQLEDLCLDRDVERRGRLVGDQDLGLAAQRHRDHHPLTHAARELVRVLTQPLGRVRDPYELQNLDRPSLAGLAAGSAVSAYRLRDLVADGERRVQAGHRFLENHRDLVAPDVPQP